MGKCMSANKKHLGESRPEKRGLGHHDRSKNYEIYESDPNQPNQLSAGKGKNQKEGVDQGRDNQSNRDWNKLQKSSELDSAEKEKMREYKRVVEEYKLREELPEELKQPLIEGCISGNEELVQEYLAKYRVEVNDITGKMEQIQVGNKTIQSENLNILHLAVYHDNLEIVKLICEGVPTLNIVVSGKIPSSSGLANLSEISVTDYESSRIQINQMRQSQKMENLTSSEVFNRVDTSRIAKQQYKVRSLILFWALDKGNLEMLDYLWTFEKFREVNWGAKNLEFMLILANDLGEDLVMEILCRPRPFSKVMKSIPFSQAMDFIEDHIINNGFIGDELKMSLLNSDEMVPYSFVGAFLHFTEEEDEQGDEDDQQGVSLEQVLSLYQRLTQRDITMISGCSEVIERFKERKLELEESKRGENTHSLLDIIKRLLENQD